ncbi:hypothetical protein DFH09DRAFT_1073168 [Mycena vulgaris]|nr:hypothetical protein DFH09DRAFT_1073168 [Mycena vulgaris]
MAAAFDRRDWVAQGKSWKDIPPHVKRVSAFDFTGDGSTILRLHHLDMPSTSMIRKLVIDGKQAWLDGFTSVKYAHIPGDTVTNFPLWIITFWNLVIDMRIQVRKPWTDATEWVKTQLKQKKRSDIRQVATETSRLLAPVHTLWRFLGPKWLSSTNEDDMLEILRDRIEGDRDQVGSVLVESVYFSDKLAAAFKVRHSTAPGDHELSQSTRWLYSLGEDIFRRGQRLITIAHLGVHNKQKHWIAIDVDGPERLLCYGDSFGEEIPPPLRDAYVWWASKHVPEPLRFDLLPTSKQTDGHSCSPLAFNAAAHAIYPNQIPLMPETDVVLGGLSQWNRIAGRVLNRVCSTLYIDTLLIFIHIADEVAINNEIESTGFERGTPEPMEIL